jgi:hypothetical protein
METNSLPTPAALGLAKAVLTYRGATTAPATLDWVLGVVVTIACVLTALLSTVSGSRTQKYYLV